MHKKWLKTNKIIKCTVCNKEFLVNTPNRKYCSQKCNNKIKAIFKKKNPKYKDRIRRMNLKRNFGISIEQYDKMLNYQENKCAICKVDYSKVSRRFAVDHCHITGKIRGLLCIECNRGLGAFDDSSKLLEKALKYLKVNNY